MALDIRSQGSLTFGTYYKTNVSFGLKFLTSVMISAKTGIEK